MGAKELRLHRGLLMIANYAEGVAVIPDHVPSKQLYLLVLVHSDV
jgi:hypothetical protein